MPVVMSDQERLKAAFLALEQQGIIARANFECCTGCGAYAMGAERESWTGDQPALGAVFFHEQNTAGANAGGALWLNHGSFADTEEINQLVAEKVRVTLTDYDFEVVWDGDTSQKMQVRPPAGRLWKLHYR